MLSLILSDVFLDSFLIVIGKFLNLLVNDSKCWSVKTVLGLKIIVCLSDKAEIKDPSFNKLVFPVGQKGVKAVNASGTYTFRKRQTGN